LRCCNQIDKWQRPINTNLLRTTLSFVDSYIAPNFLWCSIIIIFNSVTLQLPTYQLLCKRSTLLFKENPYWINCFYLQYNQFALLHWWSNSITWQSCSIIFQTDAKSTQDLALTKNCYTYFLKAGFKALHIFSFLSNQTRVMLFMVTKEQFFTEMVTAEIIINLAHKTLACSNCSASNDIEYTQVHVYSSYLTHSVLFRIN